MGHGRGTEARHVSHQQGMLTVDSLLPFPRMYVCMCMCVWGGGGGGLGLGSGSLIARQGHAATGQSSFSTTW